MEKQSILRCLIAIILTVSSVNFSYSIQADEPDRIITITADENKLYNYVSIGGFMEGCTEGGSLTRLYG